MARLNAFKIDSNAVNSGEWVSPGEEYDDLQILCRGFHDAYYDGLNQKLRRAALKYAGNADKVPNGVQRDIRVECMIKDLLIDVKGLERPDGTPVDFAAFCQLLRDPDYGQLVVACLQAAALVGRQVADDKATAAGN